MDAVPSMLEYIVRGAASAVLPMNLLVMFIGLVVGIVGGMLPGITTVTAVALFVPFTFSMPPDMALIGLGGVFCGAMYGGANAAILINTPGTPGSIATSLDGYPLVMQGRAEEACYIALLASVLGGIFGTVVLMLFFEPLSVMALKFGSEAFFWMGLFGLSTLAAMFPGNIAKGLLGGAIGLALCTVGLDPVMGMPRFTFGCFDLVQGLDMVALMIGLFSLSQMFVMLESDEKYIVKMERQAHAFKLAVVDILRHLKLLSVASAIGTFIGALPGAGGSVAALVSYNEAKRWDKDPDRYGKGAVEGILVPESANNASVGGSLVPLLSLGIPGSAAAAVLAGGLMAQGLTCQHRKAMGEIDLGLFNNRNIFNFQVCQHGAAPPCRSNYPRRVYCCSCLQMTAASSSLRIRIKKVSSPERVPTTLSHCLASNTSQAALAMPEKHLTSTICPA